MYLKEDVDDFYDIDEDRLDIFGFVSKSESFRINFDTGVFYINNVPLQLTYSENGEELPLNGEKKLIQFKDAHADLKGGGFSGNKIDAYNMGYEIQGDILFRPILKIYDDKIVLEISLKTDNPGELIIKYDGEQTTFPIKSKSGKLNYRVK